MDKLYFPWYLFHITYELNLSRFLGIHSTISNQHTRNACGSQCADDSRDQSRDGDLGHASATSRCKLRQDTHLDTNGRDVTETTDGIGSNQAGAVADASVGGASESGELDAALVLVFDMGSGGGI